MSTFTALGISVVASVIVLLATLTSRICWSWFLENVYLKISCRHLTDISGEWTARYKDSLGNDCYDHTSIVQYGHHIEGTQHYRIVFADQSPEQEKRFRLIGLLRNDIFTAYYWNEDRKQKGSGTFTLAVSKDGKVMRGSYAWFDVEEDKINAGPHEWRRSI